MWQRFTERARKVVVAAQAEAEQDGSAEVQSYHLLLGMTKEADTKAVQILEALGVSPHRLREETLQHRQPSRPELIDSTAEGRGQDIPFGVGAKRVLQVAYNAARELAPNHVGTAHLLLGLLADPDDVPAQVLQRVGIDREQVRTKVAELGEEGLGGAR